MLALAADVASWSLILAGSVFLVAGGVGLLRMPDVFTRLHPAGLIDTLGAGLVIAGLMIQAGMSFVTVKLALVLVFIFFTSPVATHALANAALSSGVRPRLADDRSKKGDSPSRT